MPCHNLSESGPTSCSKFLLWMRASQSAASICCSTNATSGSSSTMRTLFAATTTITSAFGVGRVGSHLVDERLTDCRLVVQLGEATERLAVGHNVLHLEL